MSCIDSFRIGIVSGKLGDVDGVSLEVEKWIDILTQLGHEVFTIAGKYAKKLENVPEENQLELEAIRFDSEQQQYYEGQVFPHLNNHPPYLNHAALEEILHKLEFDGTDVANKLFEYVKDYDLDVIVGQNTNAMPMTLIGGMGIYKLATERRVATIFHHHDFWWERSRFSQSHIERLLSKIMPPADPGLEHIVISSYAEHILRSIKRVQPKVIPNCEDFSKPVEKDEYNSHFRADLGFKDDDILIIQPTRIVPRKRIEDSLHLVEKYLQKYPGQRAKIHFIISLYQGDEQDAGYISRIKEMAEKAGIPLHLIAERVAAERRIDEQGRRIYTNRDVLVNADLATYLPVWEGFGNALLEAVACRVPLVIATYLVYKTDIQGYNLDLVEIRDDYDEHGALKITDEDVETMHLFLSDRDRRNTAVEKNYQIASKAFGYDKLKTCLEEVLEDYGDEIRASRKRIQRSKQRYSV